MTDTELVAGLQRRDPEAYREVVMRFGGPLHGYIYRLTQDYHLTDDILSETYLRLVEHIATYRLTGPPFSAWLYRIAHNLALNALKASRRTTSLVDGAKDEARCIDPLAAVLAVCERAELRAAFGHLTAEQRQVLFFRFVREQSPREIAQQLDKSETAVKQLQFRALRSLERLLSS